MKTGTNNASGVRQHLSSDSEAMSRLGSLIAGVSMITASYYAWIASGYINMFYVGLDWSLFISGSVISLLALVSGNATVNTLFQAGKGRVLSISLAGLSAFSVLKYGVTNVPQLAVDVYLMGFAVAVLLNSVGPEPLFLNISKRPLLARYATTVAAIALTFFALITGEKVFFPLALASCTAAATLASRRAGKQLTRALTAALMAAVVIFEVGALQSFPRYGTDELSIEMYAARLLLSGANPYVYPYFKGVFTDFPVPLSSLTPLTGGGYVQSLAYPALSFLIMVPSAVLGFDPRLTVLAFNTGLLLLLVYRYRSTGLEEYVPFVLLASVADSLLLVFPAASVTDSIWAFLVGASYVSRRNMLASGVLFGLACAFKQIALVVAPFYFFLILREQGGRKAMGFAAASSAAFLGVNLPFIVTASGPWLRSILSPESSTLIGIGQGISLLSFTGLYALPRVYFAATAMAVSLVLLAMYISKNSAITYALFTVPLFIMFLNYRFLFNYAAYWPLLALLSVPDALKAKPIPRRERLTDSLRAHRSQLTAVALLALVFVGAAPLVHAQGHLLRANVEEITVTTGLVGVSQIITSMAVNVTHPPVNLKHFMVRIFVDQDILYANGLLWDATAVVSRPNWTLYELNPVTPNQTLPAGVPFEIEVYYSGYRAYLYTTSAKSIFSLPEFQSGLHVQPLAQEAQPAFCSPSSLALQKIYFLQSVMNGQGACSSTG
ncbi:MAG: hypothetical protein QW767_01685 [Thermoprotei archaeon]